ncbi:hypothetical protein [Streptomyces varsoviensis]|uniref:Heparin-binding hemagglutinin n=1 Tax=Streptomyces varsoviensis TaxID=67373 RepID=A0ABR5JEG8_9ACTN|nr:hypothetical protein [Streptomyces varsoviensis]KOG91834.1 hypothetical protein ADK38_00975 [Streptomyces varsoviensis]
MAITEDIRKTLTDPKPLYAAAGAADATAEKIGQLIAEAPGFLAELRETDPKAVQERVTRQAKEAQVTVQAKVTEVFGSLDTDLKKWRDTAQDLALQGVGQAVGYAAKAGETYEKLAERGREAVQTWRGEAAEEVAEIAVAIEPDSEESADQGGSRSAAGTQGAAGGTAKSESTAPQAAAAPQSAAKKPAARKPASTAKKPAPKGSDQ